MGYADNIRAASSERPTCWGNSRSYDFGDPECAGCKFKHSCRAKIDREEDYQTTSIPISRPSHSSTSFRSSFRRRDENVDEGEYESGVVSQGERPAERFIKDATAGALRGMFYEMWQFWRRYRIR